MNKLFLLILFYGIITAALPQNPTYQQKLYYSCKVWGFVKYYHSQVSNCEVNWDTVLVHTLPWIKNAVTNDDFNDALDTMLLSAGPMALATSPSPDTLPPELKRNLSFGWIDDPVFRNNIKILLDTIKNNFRPHPICWINGNKSKGGYLNFPYDNPMIFSNAYLNFPGEDLRLLILFKYWNIINYFNPYNYVQNVPWDSALYNNVLSFATASDYKEFFISVRKLTANVNDAHVHGMTYSMYYNPFGSYSPAIVLRYSRDKYIVVKSDYESVTKGDVIVSVDGKTPEQWEDSLRPYISAGNPSVFRRYMCLYLLRGDNGSQAEIVYQDSMGNHQTFMASRIFTYDNWFAGYYPNDTLANVNWKKLDCNVGYVNMGKLTGSDVDSMYNVLKNTTSIIFDIRNYPNTTGWAIASLMYPESICYSRFSLPDIQYPGTFYWENECLGTNGNTNYYPGQVIILCNQETISQAEYTCMMFKAMPNSVIVGTQTAGTDGTVSNFNLSTDIQTGFTSLGVYYPNGDSTERIGIVPDSVVYITPEGIRDGRDEVLEKALQIADCLVPMLSVSPAVRNVSALAGTIDFTVNSNTNWSVVSNAEWCTVNSSGSGNGTIVAGYTENTSNQPRIANIQVTVAGLPVQTVTVNQDKSSIGFEEHQGSAFQIYPNPTKGFFRIVPSPGDKSVLDVNVLNLQGKIILEEKQLKGKMEYDFDLSFAPDGCYIIIIKTGNNLLIRKLVIIK
jgi:C-terminal processing protease CtpA/Prc